MGGDMWWMVLVACGATVEEVCDAIAHAGSECGMTTQETAPPSGARVADQGGTIVTTCEEEYEDCTDEDLQRLLDFTECLDRECDTDPCLDEFEAISDDCLH